MRRSSPNTSGADPTENVPFASRKEVAPYLRVESWRDYCKGVAGEGLLTEGVLREVVLREGVLRKGVSRD